MAERFPITAWLATALTLVVALSACVAEVDEGERCDMPDEQEVIPEEDDESDRPYARCASGMRCVSEVCHRSCSSALDCYDRQQRCLQGVCAPAIPDSSASASSASSHAGCPTCPR